MLLGILAPAWAAEWMTDLEAAKAKAAAENKAVLIDFTGSDWCGWCIRLRKQVLDTPEFEAYARDKFVLMEVDQPQNPKFDQALLARNVKIAEHYAVEGFPTLLVITPQGDLVGGFSGFKSPVQKAAEPLDKALEVAAMLKKADSLQGEEQLATLVQAYQSIPKGLRQGASALRQRIVALDPQDTTGLGRQQRLEAQRAALRDALAEADSPQAALNAVDKALEAAEPENKPGMLQIKFQIQLMSAQTVEDIKSAAVTGRAALEAAPGTTPVHLQKFDASFAEPEAVLERLQRMRNPKK